VNCISYCWLISVVFIQLMASLCSGETLLASVRYDTNPNVNGEIDDWIIVALGQIGNFAIFDSQRRRIGDVGQTFSEFGISDPGFPQLVDQLTNGNDDLLRRDHRFQNGGGGSGTLESLVLDLSVPTSGVDLEGYSITRIDQRIDALAFAPNEIAFDVTFQIYGVPEPTALSLALSTVLALCGLRDGRSGTKRYWCNSSEIAPNVAGRF